MKNDFDKLMAEVKALHANLMDMELRLRDQLPTSDTFGGVYVFFEKRKALYVGRGGNVRERVLQHSRNSVHDAPFAYRLARKATGRFATYKVEGGRKSLKKDAAFCEALRKEKVRISQMSVRYVRVEDPVTQALLEISIKDLVEHALQRI
ncbi:hypothetical protein [Pedosphaera parvula]|uniref:GIY-YIG domain-containing protein n=1 Tax=Pedosphaera parvula (strain Ellin514) TaxID=320771 RepID=B9XT13_PEDPL|nr:hypothetical protein [Pedosphaera parvula]EEF57023.1 hypothetical protein Cflav_PD0058 [Pedosphaera parvula Ellin514]